MGTIALLLPVLSAAPVDAAGIGDLVKCADFTSVYYIGDDGNRYVFPNENIYFSWYDDFDDVITISCDDLATLPIGGNIPYRPGSRLFKLVSVPTVYAVGPNGALRSIASEDQAKKLYGDDWADRIDDLSDAFWGAYTLGDELGDDELPDGFILKDGSNLYQVIGGIAVSLNTISKASELAKLDQYDALLTDIETALGISISTSSDSAYADDVNALTSPAVVDAEDVIDENKIDIDEIDGTDESSDDGTDGTDHDDGSDDDRDDGDSFSVSNADCLQIVKEASGADLPDNYTCEATKYALTAVETVDVDADYSFANGLAYKEDDAKVMIYDGTLYYIRYYTTAGEALGLDTYYSHYWIMDNFTITGEYNSYYEETYQGNLVQILDGPDGSDAYQNYDYEILALAPTSSADITDDIEFLLDDAQGDDDLSFEDDYSQITSDGTTTISATYEFAPSLYIRTSWLTGEYMEGDETAIEDNTPTDATGSSTRTTYIEWSLTPLEE